MLYCSATVKYLFLVSYVKRSPTEGRGVRLVLEPIGSLERSGKLARWDFNSSFTVITFSCFDWNSFKFFFASFKSFFCCQMKAARSSCSSWRSFSSLSRRLLYSAMTLEASSTFSANASAAALSKERKHRERTKEIDKFLRTFWYSKLLINTFSG